MLKGVSNNTAVLKREEQTLEDRLGDAMRELASDHLAEKGKMLVLDERGIGAIHRRLIVGEHLFTSSLEQRDLKRKVNRGRT